MRDEQAHARRAWCECGGVRLHRAAAHRARARHRRVRARISGAGHHLGRRPRGRARDGTAERRGGGALRRQERGVVPETRPHRHPDHDHDLPVDGHRQHVRARDHQVSDALPHQVLRLGRRPDRNRGHAVLRLTSRLRTRFAGERGAVAVMVSLLLVPMFGFAAIAVDIGSLYAEKARLQIAADAAAFAVAHDWSLGRCGDMLATARALVVANDGEASTLQPVLNGVPLSVTVTGRTPKKHWSAPVFVNDATAVSATATVGWGAPSAGTAVLPLTFSWCSFQKQTGGGLPSTTTQQTIFLTKSAGLASCTGPSGNVVPGGFGFLKTDQSGCRSTSKVGDNLNSEPGESPPNGCTTTDFAAWIGQTVLLPLFDKYGESGSNAWYHVYGYAAFRLTGYQFTGQYKTGTKPCGPGTNGNDRCVTGYYTRFVDLRDAWTYSPTAPQLGASILRLIR